MISLESARDMILSRIAPLASVETAPVDAALGRVTAAAVHARTDLPAFDNSSVDGFAVRSADLAGASETSPVTLPVTGVVAAGDSPTLVVSPGSCARIYTGAVMPAGADAVVMQEDVTLDEGGRAIFREAVRPWEGVRMAGEDLRRGARVVEAGEQLRPARLGLLAATGHAVVPVTRLARVAILATGNELAGPGEALAPGRIFDSNRTLLSALLASERTCVVTTARAPDTLEGTMAALSEATRSSDLVITTGGVSVGDADFVRAAIIALGGTVDLWRIAMKPGKPFAWGRVADAHWFGLPGNPASAFTTWWLLARPALRKLVGMRNVLGRSIMAPLAEPVANRGDRRHFMRARLNENGEVSVAGIQASHIQSGLAEANALIDLPPESGYPAGAMVRVELMD